MCPLKQKVMFISQTSLQTSETCACVTGCTKKYFRLRAWDHIVGTSKLFWYIYRLDIYIVSTLRTHTYVTWMLACASCTSCSSAGALATKALGRLDRRLTVPSEALESSKEINFLFFAPTGKRTRVICAAGKRPNHLTNTFIHNSHNSDLQLANIWPCPQMVARYFHKSQILPFHLRPRKRSYSVG